ncbi:MAG TPA: hypothetical protein PLD59_05550 [Tepidisphaeraceae bacterium]|nr:hypothetical protein [Tepidisphaeraceae bacterium]
MSAPPPPYSTGPYDQPPYPPQYPPPPGGALPYAGYDIQRITDDSHLNLLSIFHYVCGGMLALFACVPIIHIILGVMMVSGKFQQPANAPNSQQMDAAFGYFFIVGGSFAVLIGWTAAICIALAGRAIRWRRWRLFTLVMAGISCMFMPFGTVLGVFTLIVLLRPSVAAQYAAANPIKPN